VFDYRFSDPTIPIPRPPHWGGYRFAVASLTYIVYSGTQAVSNANRILERAQRSHARPNII
jgi:hypothetical protein